MSGAEGAVLTEGVKMKLSEEYKQTAVRFFRMSRQFREDSAKWGGDIYLEQSADYWLRTAKIRAREAKLLASVGM